MAPAGKRRCAQRLAAGLAALSAGAWGDLLQESCPAGAGPGCNSQFTQARAHLWPCARGHNFSNTKLVGPADLSKPLYSWFPGETRFQSVMMCGPLIDDQEGLYVTGYHGIYKLTKGGNLLWHYNSTSMMTDCPSLWNGVLFGTDAAGLVFALDIDTGLRIWQRNHSFGSMDTAYVENHDGVVIYEGDNNARVIGVRATDGEMLWDFRPTDPTWNLMAMFPGDGTVLFQDHNSRTYRLGLHNGTLLWKAGGEHVPRQTWTDGGAILGANGLIYAVSAKSNILDHNSTSGGGVHAYRVSDGALVWEKHLLRPFFTWPAVGRLHGQTRDSVVVSVGSNAYFAWQLVMLPLLLLAALWALLIVVLKCLLLACASWCWSRFRKVRGLTLAGLMLAGFPAAAGITCLYSYGFVLLPIATFHAEIYALDAETGVQQWVHELPPWPYVSAAGDGVGTFERLIHCTKRPACMPAAYSAPTIDGSGTVYIGYHSGMLLGLKDRNGDGVVTEDEVMHYDTKASFLHSGPAFAPGFMAITNCDSLYVWQI